ncbi:L-fucose:H+ symporter permease, partial [Flavobacteriaceae bacterium]|nr:L-fucose:H+ symporter permease [Flavobacteriaceae bacterium]
MSSKITPIVSKAFLVPFILITSLFFLWGVANDLTNPMVSAFKKVMPELSNFQASLVQMAFYGGYATMALPAALFIKKYSYKNGVLVGLSLYAVGALLFYPAARYEEFTFFLLSLYILTFGLAFLETTSNPYILSMGDPRTATQRLNLAQAFNPIGSLTGMLMAQILVIGNLRSDDYTDTEFAALSAEELAIISENDLGFISYPYIGLGVVIICVLIAIKCIKIPRLQKQIDHSVSEILNILWNNIRFKEGVVAQSFYVAAQIMCWTFIYQYVDNINNHLPAGEEPLVATWYNIMAMILFLVGRWICTFMMRTIDGAKLMLIFATGAVAFTTGAIVINGPVGLYCLVMVSFCMSLMFPTIYGIALKGMGDEAKLGSAFLVMAIVGGALLPPVQAKILDIGGEGFDDVLFFGFIPEINASFVLPLIS